MPYTIKDMMFVNPLKLGCFRTELKLSVILVPTALLQKRAYVLTVYSTGAIVIAVLVNF